MSLQIMVIQRRWSSSQAGPRSLSGEADMSGRPLQDPVKICSTSDGMIDCSIRARSIEIAISLILGTIWMFNFWTKSGGSRGESAPALYGPSLLA